MQEPSQSLLSKDLTLSTLLKDSMDSTKVLPHSGADKFHTPLSSSSPSRKSCRCSIVKSSPSQNLNTARANSSWSLSCLVILLVYSALSSLIQLIPWYPSSIRERPMSQLEHRSKTFTPKLDSTDSGGLGRRIFM